MTPAEDPSARPDEAIASRRAARRPGGGTGDAWLVKRRWIPRLGTDTLWRRFNRRFRKVRRRAGDAADADPGCLDLFGDGIVLAIAILVAVLLLLFVVGPLLVALVDVVILLLLALGGLIARVLFRRPWLIEAHRSGHDVLRWRVVGWRASTERVEEIRQALAAGIVPPDAEVLEAPPAEH